MHPTSFAPPGGGTAATLEGILAPARKMGRDAHGSIYIEGAGREIFHMTCVGLGSARGRRYWPNRAQVKDTRRHVTPAPLVLLALVFVVKPAVGAHEIGVLGPQARPEHPLVALPLEQLGLPTSGCAQHHGGMTDIAKTDTAKGEPSERRPSALQEQIWNRPNGKLRPLLWLIGRLVELRRGMAG